jgi:hypothetical protein
LQKQAQDQDKDDNILAELEGAPQFKIRKVEQRKIKAIELPGVSLSRMLETSPKRSFKTVAHLHEIILNWSFNHLSADNVALALKAVPSHFESVQEYTSIFENLLLEEVRASLNQAKEEQSKRLFFLPNNELDLQVTINGIISSVDKVNNFHFVDFSLEESEHDLRDNDLVLLELPGNTKTHGLMGKVERNQKKNADSNNIRLKLFLQDNWKVVSTMLFLRSKWSIKRVFDFFIVN